VLYSGGDFDVELDEIWVVEMVELILFRGILELRINSCFLYHN